MGSAPGEWAKSLRRKCRTGRSASPPAQEIEIAGLAKPNGLVAKALNLPAFIGRPPVRSMEAETRIDRVIGEFACAEARPEQDEQVQQECQPLPLEIRWSQDGRLACGRSPLKVAREAIGGRATDGIVDVWRDDDDDRPRRHVRIG